MEFEVGDFVVITRGEPYEQAPPRNPFVYMMDGEMPQMNDPDPIIRHSDFHEGKVYEVMSVAPGLAAVKCVAVSSTASLHQIDTVISIKTTEVEAMTVGDKYHFPIREWNDRVKTEIEESRKNKKDNEPQMESPISIVNGVPVILDRTEGQ